MDMIKTLLGDKFTQLTDILENNGFNGEQAQAFIPEAAKDFLGVFQNNQDAVDLANLQSTAQVFFEKIDLTALAGKVGISQELATQGIETIMPTLLQLAEAHKDKIEMLTGFASGNLGGMLGGLTGKLFGK